MSIGENIKKIRKEKAMTQKALGDKLGISQAAIGQFESNKTSMKIETIQKIAKALEVNTGDLLDIEEDETLNKITKTFPNANVSETNDSISVQIIGDGKEWIPATKEEIRESLRANAKRKLDKLNSKGVAKAHDYIIYLVSESKYTDED